MLEVDFSKFDKSQDDFTLEINLELLRLFGVPEHVLEEWEACHVCTKLIFQKFGIKIETLFQRKSGDVFTFMGNTCTGMLALAFVYDLSEVYYAIFGGDDSLIVADPNQIVPDRSKVIAEIFNLDAKLDNFPGGHYFSSRFLLFVRNTWLFVPDPMKAIFKLGRDDMYCKEHIEEYHRSFADNYKLYKCALVRREVSKAAAIRYNRYFINRDVDISAFAEFIASLVIDKDKFTSLYSGPKHLWERKLLPNIRDEFRKREMLVEEFIEEMFDEI
jgi:hypothetical protein